MSGTPPGGSKDGFIVLVFMVTVIAVICACGAYAYKAADDECKAAGGHRVDVHNGKGSWICSTDIQP